MGWPPAAEHLRGEYRLNRWRKMIQETVVSWNDHDASTQSAALAFYTIFSLGPLLLLVIAVAGAAFGADAVRGQILTEFQSWMGRDAAAFVQGILKTTAKPAANRLAGLIGVCTLIFGASGVFVQLQQSLNKVWGVVPKPGAAFKTLLRKRLLSFAVILGIGFLLVVSLILSAALTALGDFLESRFQLPVNLLHVANIVVSFILVTLLFGLIYKLLPDVQLTWRDVGLGAVTTSLLFGIGKALIGFYLGRTGAASAYGAAGSLVMIMSWIYYSALVFLLGAEFTRVQSHVLPGATPVPEAGATADPTAANPAGAAPDKPGSQAAPAGSPRTAARRNA
jgi:membrane protein